MLMCTLNEFHMKLCIQKCSLISLTRSRKLKKTFKFAIPIKLQQTRLFPENCSKNCLTRIYTFIAQVALGKCFSSAWTASEHLKPPCKNYSARFMAEIIVWKPQLLETVWNYLLYFCLSLPAYLLPFLWLHSSLPALLWIRKSCLQLRASTNDYGTTTQFYICISKLTEFTNSWKF